MEDLQNSWGVHSHQEEKSQNFSVLPNTNAKRTDFLQYMKTYRFRFPGLNKAKRGR